MLSCGLLTCVHSSMCDITACCVYLLWGRLRVVQMVGLRACTLYVYC